MKHVSFGPPGTGKTTFGQKLVQEYVDRGTRIDDVAFVAFNKEAANHAARKCGIRPEDRQELWFRTLHSACYKLMGDRQDKPDVMTSKHKKRFSKEIGLEISSNDGPGEESAEALYWDLYRSDAPESEGDAYLKAYAMSRLACETKEELEEVRSQQHPKTLQSGALDPRAYKRFIEVYESFKAREGVVDFIDMLTRVVEGRSPRPKKFRLAIVDEAQDMSPLMNRVCDMLFWDNADDVFRIGDDDQAIYQFMMTRAEDFLAYRSGSKVITLRDTHRFGKDIVDLSAKIAERLEHRHPKDVIPLENAKHDIHVDFKFDPQAFEASIGSPGERGLVLHRHVAGCRAIGERFLQAGIPFWNERGINPLAADTQRKGYLAFQSLCELGAISYTQLLDLIEAVPSKKTLENETVILMHHGAKTKIRSLMGQGIGRAFTCDLMKEYFTDTFLTSIREKSFHWLDIKYAEYYQTLMERGYDLKEDRPRITITTIHGSKGREAELVALFSESFPRALMSADEHRVPYVGVTRTKRDLWIVREPVVGDWTREYPYPGF